MHDAALMGRIHTVSNLFDNLRGFFGAEWPVFEFVRETAALDEFQCHVRQVIVLFAVEDLHNIWMLECRHRFRLRKKSCQIIRTGMNAGENHFQRDNSIELEMLGFVHNTHTATTKFPKDFIAGNSDVLWNLRQCRFTSMSGSRFRHR